MRKRTSNPSSLPTSPKKHRTHVRSCLQLAQLRYEKCELAEARVAFNMAFKSAQRAGDLRHQMEAIAGLLRLAADSLDEEAIRHWDQELDALMTAHSRQVPPMAWYCKGVIARRTGDLMKAQRHVHHYLRLVRAQSGTQPKEPEAKGWVLLSSILWQRRKVRRAQWLAENILKRYENDKPRGIEGLTSIVLGAIAEGGQDVEGALRWYQRAHASFLSEHNWYYHLYVLYGYARIYRQTADGHSSLLASGSGG